MNFRYRISSYVEKQGIMSFERWHSWEPSINLPTLKRATEFCDSIKDLPAIVQDTWANDKGERIDYPIVHKNPAFDEKFGTDERAEERAFKYGY